MDDNITTGTETAVSLPGKQMIRTVNPVKKGTHEPLVNYRPHFLLRNGNVQTILSRHIRPDAHLVTRGEQMLLLAPVPITPASIQGARCVCSAFTRLDDSALMPASRADW